MFLSSLEGFILLAAIFTTGIHAMQCPADRPNAGCFQYINPFSANAYQWAAQGIQVTSPDALIGGPFIEFDDGVLGW